MLTDSAAISLSKCCLLQSLKRSLNFPVVWLGARFFTQTKHTRFPQSCSFLFPSNPCFCLPQSAPTTIFYTPSVSSPLVFSPHPSISAMTANPCRCWSAGPFSCGALCSVVRYGLRVDASSIGRLTAKLWLSSDRPGCDSILQVSQRLLLSALISVLQAKAGVLSETIRWSIGGHVSSRSHLIQVFVQLILLSVFLFLCLWGTGINLSVWTYWSAGGFYKNDKCDTYLMPPKLCRRSGSRSRVEWGETEMGRDKESERGPYTHTEKALSPGNVCFEEVLHAACE